MSHAASPDLTAGSTSQPISRGDRVATIIIVLLYIALQCVLAVGHQPWRDEAQAWLWAQNLSGLRDFLIIPGEGHPPLWYWILRGLSLFLDFSQARYFTLVVAIVNAVLLARLLRGDVLILALLLCSHVVMQYWGYHFRPYSLVLTAVLGALLLERNGRSTAASWILALACGFHFYAGFLFALWLLVQLQRGARLPTLLGPAALGLFFGACALVSGLGNPEGAPSSANLADMIAFNLAWPLTWPVLRIWPTSILSLALLCYGLWHQRAILLTLLALTILFAVGAAAVYGESPWHSAFMMVMTVMAFVLAGPGAKRWVLIVLLTPQAVAGIAMVKNRLENPSWERPDLYAVIQSDAGASFDPSRQLIGWQDYNLSPIAAAYDISYISGNNGALLGPVDWRYRSEGAVDPVFGTIPTPYWLICNECAPALTAIAEAGRATTELARSKNFDDGMQIAYRVD
ncbi:hypothetical protein [Devosia neptuniae]|uniref:hypothetical protein n=1 Tax=Devosia TaxID=46913 RepID=UPI0022AEABCF|nr:hypothetical protein [Devosia neptuniae]MCZ4345941.1 hypothetical protein [Devosia neptuniae]